MSEFLPLKLYLNVRITRLTWMQLRTSFHRILVYYWYDKLVYDLFGEAAFERGQ
jgi:hypothetical protein